MRASNTKLNRLKEKKSKRRRRKTKSSRASEKYVGLMKRYSYWWPIYDRNFVSEKGFITEELALNCRNQFLLKEYGDYAKENIINIDKNILIEDLIEFRLTDLGDLLEKNEFPEFSDIIQKYFKYQKNNILVTIEKWYVIVNTPKFLNSKEKLSILLLNL